MINNKEIFFQIIDIIRGTTVDGPGFRTSIYFAGCPHHCYNCHNPHSWDPHGGERMSLKEIMEIVEEEDFDVTLSGGDPLFCPHSIQVLIKALKENRRNVWIYTGYTWEEIVADPDLLHAISDADVIVEGRFIDALKDPDLMFRGSSNQRILKIRDSIAEGKPINYFS